MKIVILPRKEFTEKYGARSIGARLVSDEGENVIELRKGASTSTKLHELAHTKQSYPKPGDTWGDVWNNEMDAEVYNFRARGKALTWRISLPLVWSLIDEGYRPSGIFSLVLKMLRSRGVPMGRKARSALWWTVRDTYPHKRTKVHD